MSLDNNILTHISSETMQVECAFVLDSNIFLIPLKCPVNASVYDALLLLDGIVPKESLQIQNLLRIGQFKVGIFSQVVALDNQLKQGDRIELYTPLIIDPKVARMRRAAVRKYKKH